MAARGLSRTLCSMTFTSPKRDRDSEERWTPTQWGSGTGPDTLVALSHAPSMAAVASVCPYPSSYLRPTLPVSEFHCRSGLCANTIADTGRYPIWHAACKHAQMQYSFKAPGKKSLDTDFVKLAAIPERSSRHPDLKFLAEALTNYLYKFRSYLVDEVCAAHEEYVQHISPLIS